MCDCYRTSTLIYCVAIIWISNGNTTFIRQDVAEETQHAICNISTKDVQTSANASVTRQLKGVCTSSHLDLRFKELEIKLIKELHSIKKILSQTLPESLSGTFDHNVAVDSTEISEDVGARALEVDDEGPLPIFNSFKTIIIRNESEKHQEPIFIFSGKTSETEQISSFPSKTNRQNVSKLITDTNMILKLNDTVQKTEKSKIYYYFWKVENFNDLMKKSGMYKTSPTFLVLGHEVNIQLFPNQPRQDYLTVKLRSSRSFMKKHKFSIMRRTSTGQDIHSTLLGMDLRGTDKFFVTLKSIRNEECLKEDSIFIELNIYL